MNKHIVYPLYFLLVIAGTASYLSAVADPEQFQPSSGPTEGPIQGKKSSAPEPVFKISDEELKMLNLDEKEAKELEQFFDALNNLTPAQKKELEDLGRATEEKMRKQGLDPNNMDDLMKFMETEGLTPPKEEPQARPKAAPAKPVAKPAPVAPEIVPVVSPKDTKEMLDDLIDRIARLRQNVSTRKQLYQKFETIEEQVIQLNFYLNVLRQPDLTKLLTSKEFVELHNSIQNLQKNFTSFEPSITAKKTSDVIDSEDPYTVLNLPYNATNQELEEQFARLKTTRSPEAVKAGLEKEKCDKDLCKAPLKAAERSFGLIEQAYKKLKDPKTRAQVDATLRAKITQENTREQQSQLAFEKLFSVLRTAFSGDRVLENIDRLLKEKYKPEELKQMKAQLELEKQAFERSKKRVMVPQSRENLRPTTEPYDAFYRQMGKTSQQPSYQPSYSSRRDRPMPGRPGALPAEKAQSSSAPAAPKADGKKEAPKKVEKKDDKKKPDDKKQSPAKPELGKGDIKQLSSIDQAGEILESWKKKKGTITVQPQLRSPSGQPVEVNFDTLVSDLNEELIAGPADKPQAAANIDKFFKEYKIYDLEKVLKKAAPAPGKKLTGVVADEWKEKVAPHAKTIQGWHAKLSNVLDIRKVHDAGKRYRHTGNVDKRLYYGLTVTTDTGVQKYQRPQEGPVPVPPGGVNLGELYTTLDNLNKYVAK